MSHLRLILILKQYTSESQGAFLEGRCATDRIIIAKEMTHIMAQNCSKNKICALKIDIHKACYNTVDWQAFSMGFHNEVVARLMYSVTIVLYQGKDTSKLQATTGGPSVPEFMYHKWGSSQLRDISAYGGAWEPFPSNCSTRG